MPTDSERLDWLEARWAGSKFADLDPDLRSALDPEWEMDSKYIGEHYTIRNAIDAAIEADDAPKRTWRARRRSRGEGGMGSDSDPNSTH